MVFRHYDTATLFCRACEHAWTADVEHHPELGNIKPERSVSKS